MKKLFIALSLIFAMSSVHAQSKELRDSKQQANRELNNGMHQAKNAGDEGKFYEAKQAKSTVKKAETPEKVREAVKDYRSGNSKVARKAY